MIFKGNNIRETLLPLGFIGIFVGSLLAYTPINNPLVEDFDALTVLPDSTEDDTGKIELIYPFEDKSNEGLNEKRSPLFLNDPSNINKKFEYNPETGEYNYSQKLGERDYRAPSKMSLDEYLKYDMEQANRDFWRKKSSAETLNESEGFRPQINVKGKLFDRIFGGNVIDIRPQGSAELSFGLNISRRDNPIIPERQRRTTNFDFKQKIQLNVVGNIGEKLRLQTNFNTEATFDFENQMKLEYTGYEDEIIQKIEAGNVSLPLQSSLITGSQTLFGVKTELQFGRLRVTSIFSQEKGEKKEINLSGGAQVREFEKSASEYDENQHFFLSHLFREAYESNLANPPRVTSRINITALEVYVTNTRAAFNNTRNILGFLDLGNDRRIYNPSVVNRNNQARAADNAANDLYANLAEGFPQANEVRNFNNADAILQQQGLISGSDYERLENAVLLSPNEYTFNKELGYISLNRTLNPQDVLAVSFRYTYNGQTYQVGDLSTDGIDGQQALYLKLLKGTIINPALPSWDLMMKNVYSLDAFNISQNNFNFEIWYLDQNTGVEIPYFPEGKPQNIPLINTLGLDRVSVVNDPQPDGLFDYIPNITINPKNGRIYFPVLEPFGDYLKSRFDNADIGIKYAYDSLYSTTKILAQQDVDHNRYTFKGRYESSSGSEISLNTFNIPEGSVVVTAGGTQLVENQDYTVDYNLGRVRILNDGVLASGQPIKVTLGSNSLFNVQTKTLLGSRFDYRVSDDINIGATVLNLTERPLTRKINIGDEPISNTVVGIDGSYATEVPIITQIVDKLPFYSTSATSSITLSAEVARLFPGNSRAITKEGVAYIDDFEGSQTVLDIRQFNAWRIASTPQGQDDLFPEGNLNNNLAYGFNRAKLAWYTIDPLFFRNDSRTPDHIRDSESQSNNFSREVLETEVFPNKDPDPGLINNLPTLDLAFYPRERGPYNFDSKTSIYSAGLNTDGSLKSPASRWGGIMRDIQSSDFEASNVEFIQFWIMDPFNEQDGNPNHGGGDLFFNIGSISEDVLKDSRKSFENGLPIDGSNLNTGNTVWGRIPTIQSVVNAFDLNPSSRQFQDIGLDGLSSAQEQAFFQAYLDTLGSVLDPTVFNDFFNDPAGDDYHYYRGGDYDAAQLSILERYKEFNGLEGNSPTTEQSPESYSTAATTLPDIEDANRNFNLDRTESYYQYKVRLTPELLQPENVGSNFITDVVRATTEVNGDAKRVNWYQFKIPIRDPERVIGDIRDFKSIRFMRMFLKGFNEEVVVRFARLGLVRGEWRRYEREDIPPGDTHGGEPGATTFNVAAVNVEENANRVPINYTIPPDINREIDFGTTNLRQLNEQSLVLDVCDLQDGSSRFAFRYLDLDIRYYERIKMFAHAEVGDESQMLNDGDVSVVMRLGTDFENSYYEYEVPLKVTLAGQNDPRLVWPSENEINLQFEKLINAKQNRNRLTVSPSNGVDVGNVYEIQDGNNTIRIKGNPNLSEVRVIMLGVRNRRGGLNNTADDGLPKCAEVWVNELRLSDFNNRGGWASTARMRTKIADLGTANLSGSYSTPGWGSLEQKLNERQRETRQQYNLSANMDVAKLLPEGSNVSIPLYFSVSEQIVRPEFNPLDPDVRLNDVLRSNEFTDNYKDSIRKITDDYTSRKSINFTNVRKLPGPNKKKSNIYDLENFSFTYAYSEIFQRNINTKFDRTKNYRGAVNYTYAAREKSIEPFKNIQFIKKSKALKLLQEFNFNLIPSQISFQNEVLRNYRERQNRTITAAGGNNFIFDSPAFFQKNFNWTRRYTIRHNFTKSLSLNFNATNQALIGEPEGRVSKDEAEAYDRWKNQIWGNIKSFGQTTNYNHSFDLTYQIPINKFPGLDFVTANTSYSGTFAWDVVGDPEADTSLGATIRNSNNKSITGNLNLEVLYNKFKYVQDLKDPKIDNRYVIKEEEKVEKGKNSNMKKPPSKIQKIDQGEQLEEELDTNIRKKFFLKRYLMDNAIWTIMSLKTVTFNYSETEGTTLPNFGKTTSMAGMDSQWDAPGFRFVAGLQEDGDQYLFDAFENGWLNEGVFINGDFSRTFNKQYSVRVNIRPPIDGLRIQLSANKSQSESYNRFFFYDDADSVEAYNFDSPPIVGGNFSMSFLSFNTAFIKDNEDTFDSETFQQLRQNRSQMSQRIGRQNANSRGLFEGTDGEQYADGFGESSQDVLLYSFLAAYSGQDAGKITLRDFTQMMPMPNWNITYDGLSKIPLLKKYFRNVTLNHRYTSTFTVGSFTRNQVYGVSAENGDPNVRDINENFIMERQLANVTINERFSPLIKVNMNWNNSLITNLEMRQDRSVAMSFSNNQVTETKGQEYIITLGYTVSNLKLPFKVGRVERASDLVINFNFSVRNNQTIIRRVVENRNELTAGQRIFSIKFSADYRFSSRLNLRLFYDRVGNTPLISSSFPTANTNAGMSLRFTLSQ